MFPALRGPLRCVLVGLGGVGWGGEGWGERGGGAENWRECRVLWDSNILWHSLEAPKKIFFLSLSNCFLFWRRVDCNSARVFLVGGAMSFCLGLENWSVNSCYVAGICLFVTLVF